MGRKGNWFKTVKNALTPKSKRKKDQKHPSSGCTPTGQGGLTCVENEECHYTYPAAVSTSTAVKTSTSKAGEEQISGRIATRFVQPIVSRKTKKSMEEVAAIKIQSVFRGYLARTEMQTIKGLARLKSLMDGSVVHCQAANALHRMKVFANVHSQIQSRRLRKLEDNQALQKQILQKHAKELENLQAGKDWNDSIQSKEQIEAKLQSKHEAALRRERALAYAFSHQKTWRNSSRSINPLFTDPRNPTWGWSWLERWMATQPWQSPTTAERHINNEISSRLDIVHREINTPETRFQPNLQTNSPAASQYERHGSTSPSLSMQSKQISVAEAEKLKPSSSRKSIGGHGSSVRDDESRTSSSILPSYMTFTESARAKSRLQSASFRSGEKRLCYPPAPAISRRRSDILKVESWFSAENGISNGVSYMIE